MGQLHETLAVEKSLQAASQKLQQESVKTLRKENLFSGQVKVLKHFDDANTNLDVTTKQVMETTVDENLAYLLPVVGEHWDCVLQKEHTNQHAKAAIIIDDKNITGELPVTFLLGLESKLADLRKVFVAAHTLPPGRAWAHDVGAGAGRFKSEAPDVTFKEEKVLDFRIICEPTKEHPAQIREVNTTKKTGKYTTDYTCGMLTPAEKARRLGNLDKLLAAVKKARQRANTEEVLPASVASILFKFINE